MSLIHKVEQGECLSSIAAKYGVPWRRIYDHPDNGAFREKRPNPNLIRQGDQLHIPDLEIQDLDKSTDQQHVFQLEGEKTKLALVVEDEIGRALASKKFKLEISGSKAGNLEFEGETGGDGSIEKEIPADATSGELTLFAAGGGYSWSLRLGHLDPHDEISGIQGRLHNLGYDCCDANVGELDDVTREALKAFQFAAGLKVTGDPDNDTVDKLKKLHD